MNAFASPRAHADRGRAVVIGGGVAGMCAAFALRDGGWRVTLCESRGWLGGRAFTLPRRESEPAVDNGPHVILGCYDAFRRLLRRIGTEDRFAVSKSLSLAYAEPDGRTSVLQLRRGPVPLTFPLGLLGIRALPFRERMRALRGLIASARIPRAAMSFADWLQRHHQAGAPRAWLWDPMCRAIVNAEAEEVDAALMLGTLRQAFGGSGARAAIWIPTVPWREILDVPALAALRAAEVEVLLHRRVRAIRLGADRATAIEFHGEERIELRESDRVVLAVPWHVASTWVPSLQSAGNIASKPMVTVAFHGTLAADAAVPRAALLAFVGGDPFHFWFRRPSDPLGHFALISGGARGLEDCSVDAILDLARRQLARYFPTADFRALHGRVTREDRATLLPSPGSDVHRPKPGRVPGFTNLAVVGDWTATALPSTLEGAARSGWSLS
jgi:squalene-associated FAD-dependent desaturase